MSGADTAFYQTAKGGLAMRLSNAEQMALGREGIFNSQEARRLTLDDDIEHAKTNRDASIFGLSLGGSGAYKAAYGIGKAVGGRILDRGLARLQNAADQYRRTLATQRTPEDEPPETEETGTGVGTETTPETAEAGVGTAPETAEASTMMDINDPIPRNLLQTEYQQRVETSQQFSRAGIEPTETVEQIQGEYARGLDPTREGRLTQLQREQLRETQSQTEPQEEEEEQPRTDEPAPEEDLPQGRTGGLAGGFDPEQDAGQAIRAAARPATGGAIIDPVQNRLAEIQGTDPILSEDNVGQLKKMGVELGDLTPEEVDTGARLILGDSAVEGISSALGVAGSVLGTALPIVGTIGDLVGVGFAIKGLVDSNEAVEREKQEQTQLKQSIAQTNIPVQVAKQGSAPVLDSSTNRVGGFMNY